MLNPNSDNILKRKEHIRKLANTFNFKNTYS